MRLRIAFPPFLVFLGLGAFAQTAPSSQIDNARRAGDLAGTGLKFQDYAASCMEIDAMLKVSKADLQLVREYKKYLGWVAPALGITDAALAAYQGKNLESALTIGSVAADTLLCSNLSPRGVCPAWTVGVTIGDVINGITSQIRADKRDFPEISADYLADVLYDRPATARELVRLQLALANAEANKRKLAETKKCTEPKQKKASVDSLLRSLEPPENSSRPRSVPSADCETLKDTQASESLMERDPNAYDALLAKCLK